MCTPPRPVQHRAPSVHDIVYGCTRLNTPTGMRGTKRKRWPVYVFFVTVWREHVPNLLIKTLCVRVYTAS